MEGPVFCTGKRHCNENFQVLVIVLTAASAFIISAHSSLCVMSGCTWNFQRVPHTEQQEVLLALTLFS